MAQTYIDPEGLVNVSESIIGQARRDFIKGGKILYGWFGYIPEEKEWIESKRSDTLQRDIYWFYDAWRFVKNDPYDVFGEVGEDQIIRIWTNDAITEYYKALYLIGAQMLFAAHVSKQDIKENDEAIKKAIGNDKLAEDFITARDHVYKLSNGPELAKQWNVIAYGRAKRYGRGIGKQRTEYHKKVSEKRRKNIEKTKELWEAGMSANAIAKELGVGIATVHVYIRSINS